jgi:hypothetical protein
MRQVITGGDGASGQTGEEVMDIINENFDELYHNTIDEKTDDHTLVLADEMKLLRMNKATALSLTVPPNASVAFPIGERIRLRRTGVGVLTVAAGVGVTVTGSAGGLTDAGLNVDMLLEKLDTNTWILQNGSPGTYLDYVPTFGGFSSPPSSVGARYNLIGKTCHVIVNMGANGTSNATTFTMTLPFAAANTFIQSDILPAVINNSGSLQTTPGRIDTIVNSNVANLYLNTAAAAWTASNGKRAFVNFTYEIA